MNQQKKIEFLYQNEKYCDIIDLIERSGHVENSELQVMFSGFSYLELQNPMKALDCLESIDPYMIEGYTGKIYRYIALAKYLLGDYSSSLSNFKLSICSQDDEALLWKKLLFPDNIIIHETENINFRFVDSIDKLTRKVFIMRALKAHKRILDYIGKSLQSKKIDIYIYDKRFDSLENPLSYTDNGIKTIHIYYNDLVGHEISHAIVNSLYPQMSRCTVIDEGTATYFDELLPYSEYLRKNKNRMIRFDILEYWENNCFNKIFKTEFYYFAGAFVGYLLETFGKEKFLLFIKDQSPSNAEKVFGEAVTVTIKKFYYIIEQYI